MEEQEKILKVFVRSNGKAPFLIWMSKLKDPKTEQRIEARLNRLRLGLIGDCKKVREGVFELRLDYGPGYRIYFGSLEGNLIILLIGGDKSTQQQDIENAQQYWKEYKQEREDANY